MVHKPPIYLITKIIKFTVPTQGRIPHTHTHTHTLPGLRVPLVDLSHVRSLFSSLTLHLLFIKIYILFLNLTNVLLFLSLVLAGSPQAFGGCAS